MGTATRIIKQSYPLWLRQAIDDSLKDTDSGLVDLITGIPPQDCQWQESTDPSQIEQIEQIRTHLNGLEFFHFEPMLSQIRTALKMVDTVSHKDPKVTANQKRNCKVIIERLFFHPIPQYHCVAKSPRLYTGPCFLTLPRKVRETLTAPYWKIDINAAQLRTIFGVLKLDWPEDWSDSPWPSLLKMLGRRKDSEATKDAVKKTVYAATFGRTSSYSRIMANIAGVAPILEHPSMKALMEARDSLLEELKKGSPIQDAWGKVYQVDAVAYPTERLKRSNACSNLACVCQSFELRSCCRTRFSCHCSNVFTV
jgi:hypothetical protein